MTPRANYILDILPGCEAEWVDGLAFGERPWNETIHNGNVAQQGEKSKATAPLFSVSPLEGRTGTAVLYVHGSLYGWSYEYIKSTMSRWDSNENIEKVVLDFDSPGGLASGCGDCAESIKSVSTPTSAHVRSMAASAAYWLASAADDIRVKNDAIVGSVGTVVAHIDYSKALERIGLKVSFITAGEGKVDGNSYEPLSDAGQAKFQKIVDEHYSSFSNGVAENRGINQKVVKDEWGAHIYTGRESLENGMADSLLGQPGGQREVRRAYAKHRLAPRR